MAILLPNSTIGGKFIEDVEGSQKKVDLHANRTDNPHGVTKEQLGLGNVDNTADSAKNVATATRLATARTISLGGDLSGSASFNGSANITITATIADDSHDHVIGNVDGLQSALDDKMDKSGGTFTGGVVVLGSAADKSLRVRGMVGSSTDGASIDDLYLQYQANKRIMLGSTGAYNISADGSQYSGNSASATKLATARTVALTGDVTGSASFDGTSNITITATIADDSHDHVIGNVDGLQDVLDLKAPLASPSLTGTPSAPTATAGTNTTQLATTAFVTTAVNNKTTITGNAGTATKLATARTISLGGDLSGSASFDGSANITITAVVLDDSHDHVIGNVDGLQDALDLKAPLASPSLSGTPTAPTASSGTNTTQLATTAFVTTAVNNKTTITGNAGTATKLATARTVALTGDVTGSATFDGSANISINATIADDSHDHVIGNVDGLQDALDSKAPVANPTFTGSATSPSFKSGKFEIAYNASDDSLDFIYTG